MPASIAKSPIDHPESKKHSVISRNQSSKSHYLPFIG